MISLLKSAIEKLYSITVVSRLSHGVVVCRVTAGSAVVIEDRTAGQAALQYSRAQTFLEIT